MGEEMKGGPETAPAVLTGLFSLPVHMQASPLFHKSVFAKAQVTEEYSASSHRLWCVFSISCNRGLLRYFSAGIFLLWTFLQKTASRNFHLYLSSNRILEDP